MLPPILLRGISGYVIFVFAPGASPLVGNQEGAGDCAELCV